jgi:NADPH:quinone reductase-like Zn-dependent oxidoreductase
MGTRDEFLSMIDFIESRNIKPVIDQTFSFEEYSNAFSKMENSNQFGKIVLKID